MFGEPNLANQTSYLKEAVAMPRPAARDLTQRELEVMHIFWRHGSLTAGEARDHLADQRELTYTTVATLVRILHEKGFLKQMTDDRPFVYAPARSYEEVSERLLGDVLHRVFRGSREQLLVRLLESRQLSNRERAFLQALLGEEPS
jgi:BlaI family transcriptional regulator, penicillinase repressor